jgi:hypothetical protein
MDRADLDNPAVSHRWGVSVMALSPLHNSRQYASGLDAFGKRQEIPMTATAELSLTDTRPPRYSAKGIIASTAHRGS